MILSKNIKKTSNFVELIELTPVMEKFFAAIYAEKNTKMSLNDYSIKLLKQLTDNYFSANFELIDTASDFNVNGVTVKNADYDNIRRFITLFEKSLVTIDKKFAFFFKGLYYEYFVGDKKMSTKYINHNQLKNSITEKYAAAGLSIESPLTALTGRIKFAGLYINCFTDFTVTKK